MGLSTESAKNKNKKDDKYETTTLFLWWKKGQYTSTDQNIKRENKRRQTHS